ncbi:cytochrome P450 family 72 subfamily A polypeptide 8 [Zea mays]|uniref:Cytochrome P450 family 72 subfamily A polypeptide 8 n=1 Tax=Zea mays TaxID=4577 RepID=A0A1D6MPA7_MAIZE|nr:cytochrome P450 family 72 subfamily A polypeptide 8 [Zea mays]
MLPAFASCCADLVSTWERLVVAADGEPCEVDIWPDMQRLTGDVISRVAFGSSYLEGRRIFELQEEQVHLAMLVAGKIHIPGYMMLPTRVNRRMKRIAAEIEGILRRMIATRESSLRAGKATSDDLLGLLLESNMEQLRGEGGGGGGGTSSGGMSTDDIIGEEEVLRVFGGASCRVLDYDGLSRLKIVTMVLYEVLRLYTPLPALHRRTYKPMELGGVRPERFAEGVARASSAGDAPPSFFPFGWGPRTCVGQTFALLEAKIGLAMILGSFTFELSPSYSHAPFPVVLLKPEHGAQVKLRKLP